MNDQRRAQIRKALIDVEAGLDRLRELLEEEREAFDNRPENFQQSDSGEAAETGIQTLEDACEEIESAVNSIRDSDELGIGEVS